MKVFLSVLFIGTSLISFSSSQSVEKNYYSRRYDSLDVNTIFRSSRLLNNYVDCLLDKKPCPPEGKDLKRVLPDALKTRCGSCTKLQKEKALDVITRLYYQHPTIYTALAGRYDPTGEYTRNFENWFDEQNAVKPRPPIPQEISPEGSDNVQIDQNVASETGNENANGISSTQQTVRRSPVDTVVRTPNDVVQPERTRIPSTWITSSTKATTQRTTTTRVPLRTLPPTARTSTQFREPAPVTARPLQPNFQIDNIFVPRPNGPITRSINKLLDTTEKVVNGFAGMFRSTIEIITGTG